MCSCYICKLEYNNIPLSNTCSICYKNLCYNCGISDSNYNIFCCSHNIINKKHKISGSKCCVINNIEFYLGENVNV